ncbi:hypothetical protein [Chromobacterium amazonense]|uniref:hypothetical protein n=1 Tax=Chromobacterium amazonense TaxID=1382803 RepID=UPI003F7ACF52
MRKLFILLPLALSSAQLAASSLPSYDFAVKPAHTPANRPYPFEAKNKTKPLEVAPRVPLGDLDKTWLEMNASKPVDGDMRSRNPNWEQQHGYQTMPAWRRDFPGQPMTPGLGIDPQTGKKRAIPMHMLQPLPPYQNR